MAKEVLATSHAVLLPRWASGDVAIEPELLAIVSAHLEVPLLDGAARPDALIRGMAQEIEFDVLCVEVRVHHAVDEPKSELLAANGLDAIEIDLSRLTDDAVADLAAFRYEVLENPRNRRWVHLSHASYVAQRADKALIEVEDPTFSERVIITKAGRPFTIREQWAFLVKPGSRGRVRIQIPDETVGEDAVPYPRGMHAISGRSITVDGWGRLRLRYKMYLDQIQMNPPQPEGPQRGLFDADNGSEGPGFNVRVRDWKGRPGW
ncbi:single-stranded DNA-binding protein [Lysobacter sp. TY2-98]|uniref:single-stranded DNA-binding protein n=1 Tax=Lysobacter sp. TY2-98 TaxID=2290922 RepID=UPI0013B3F596|nr:single-stranded DNA-binding protein [Lysobacter sp. TY2-98]